MPPYTFPDSPAQTEANPARQLVDGLMQAVEQILRTHPEGLDEHSLLGVLQSPEWCILAPVDFRDPARLYPVHFLVFHALYQLRDRLRPTGETLVIGALRIKLQPAEQGDRTYPDTPEPLADFYRNLDNIKLERQAIESMLDDFWKGIQQPPTEEMSKACEVLGLECPPADIDTANLQFRRLAMLYHPDRGGTRQQLQRINGAIALVRKYFRSCP